MASVVTWPYILSVVLIASGLFIVVLFWRRNWFYVVAGISLVFFVCGALLYNTAKLNRGKNLVGAELLVCAAALASVGLACEVIPSAVVSGFPPAGEAGWSLQKEPSLFLSGVLIVEWG